MKLHFVVLFALAALALAKNGKKKKAKKTLASFGIKTAPKIENVIEPSEEPALAQKYVPSNKPLKGSKKKTKKVTKSAAKAPKPVQASSGELPFEEGSADDGSASNPQDPAQPSQPAQPSGGSAPAAPSLNSPVAGNKFGSGPAATPVTANGNVTPTPAARQPGYNAARPNPLGNVGAGKSSNTQFNPTITANHLKGSGCYATFGSAFNSATSVSQRNQYYATLRTCLAPKCDVQTCADQFTTCNGQANNEEKTFQCNYNYFGCSNEKCDASS